MVISALLGQGNDITLTFDSCSTTLRKNFPCAIILCALATPQSITPFELRDVGVIHTTPAGTCSTRMVIPESIRTMIQGRAVARSEILVGLVVLGGDNVSPLVEIGLADLPNIGGAKAPPPAPTLRRPCGVNSPPEDKAL